METLEKNKGVNINIQQAKAAVDRNKVTHRPVITQYLSHYLQYSAVASLHSYTKESVQTHIPSTFDRYWLQSQDMLGEYTGEAGDILDFFVAAAHVTTWTNCFPVQNWHVCSLMLNNEIILNYQLCGTNSPLHAHKASHFFS